MTVEYNSESMFIFLTAMKQSCQSRQMESFLQNVYGKHRGVVASLEADALNKQA